MLRLKLIIPISTGLLTGIGAASADQTTLVQQALLFENAYWPEWSADNDQTLAFVSSVVGESITSYGTPMSHNQFMKIEAEFVNRWPQRSYVPEPSSVSVTCQVSTATCQISGILDWDDRSVQRDARSIGKANFDYQIVNLSESGQAHFVIVSESGSVITRTSGSLESFSIPTARGASPPNPQAPAAINNSPIASQKETTSQSGSAIALINDSGVLKVPVTINGVLPLNFVIDSGASDVSIPADVVLTLMRTGTIQASDFLGSQTYELADGSTVPSETFNIRSLKVGNEILYNVIGSVANVDGELLLGQSFLSRFKSWSINNSTDVLQLSN